MVYALTNLIKNYDSVENVAFAPKTFLFNKEPILACLVSHRYNNLLY